MELDPRQLLKEIKRRYWMAVTIALIFAVGAVIVHDKVSDEHQEGEGRGTPVFRRVRFFNGANVKVHSLKIYHMGQELVDAEVGTTGSHTANARDAGANGFKDAVGDPHGDVMTVEFEIHLDKDDDGTPDAKLDKQTISAKAGHRLGGILICLEDNAAADTWNVTAAGFGSTDEWYPLEMNPAVPTAQAVPEVP